MRNSEHELLARQSETTEERLRALRERNTLRTTTQIVGPPGEPGVIGPMPKHQWRHVDDRVELRFQQTTTEWGAWTDVRGPAGQDGVTRVVSGGGGGPIVINSFWPQGWT